MTAEYGIEYYYIFMYKLIGSVVLARYCYQGNVPYKNQA